MRFPLVVFDAVGAVWPPDKPLAVTRGGDAVEVLAGQPTAGARAVYDPTALIQLGDRIRNEALVATLAAGRIRLAADVNNVVASGRADLCCIDPPTVNTRLQPIRSVERRREPSATMPTRPIAEVLHDR